MRARLIILTILIIGAGALGYAYFTGLIGKQSVTSITENLTQKPAVFLHGPADLVTPLGKGYIFINKNTRGINYAEPGAVTDISGRFLLSASPTDSTQKLGKETYNTVINIEPAQNGEVVVTTTKGLFLVKSAQTITKLPSYGKTDLDFTASAYDAQTNSVLLLSAYSKAIYRYSLAQPTTAPTVLYTAQREMNRLAASGGKAVAYFDDIPSSEAAVMTEYAKTRQLTPLVIDITSAKLTKQLGGYEPATYLSVSGSGNYLAVKKKLASTISIINLASGRTTTIPSYDTGAAHWQNDTFFFARKQGIISYDATAKTAQLSKIATVTQPAVRLLVTSSQTIVTTNDDATAQLAPLSQSSATPQINLPPGPSSLFYLFLAVPSEAN